jgi:hypothetical protein
MRLSIALAVVALCVAPGGTASPLSQRVHVHRYLVQTTAQVTAYRKLLGSLEGLLTQEPQVNVDPVVEQLTRLADRFEDLDARWETIEAPRGLRVRHRGMGRVFVLFAESIHIHADAIYTRHRDEILAAGPKVQARLRSAAYLQKRWAAALQGALIRNDLAVPTWLHRMATAPLS